MSVVKRKRPLSDVLEDELGEAGLEERHLAGAERLDLLRVDVDAHDLEAHLGHSGRVGRSEVAGADNADTGWCCLAVLGRVLAGFCLGIHGEPP
jgi:hypothetical protein